MEGEDTLISFLASCFSWRFRFHCLRGAKGERASALAIRDTQRVALYVEFVLSGTRGNLLLPFVHQELGQQRELIRP